ncbi:MAG: ABC transporter permease [Actinomycetota bacterium]|nr:ABC transporter permease [Actinomycetota bacterium]
MIRYALRRLAYGVIVLVLVTVFVFVVMRLVPGDVVTLQLQDAAGVTTEEADELRGEFGLDAPVHAQLWDWVRDAARGDLGNSFWTDEPVTDMIMRRVPPTLVLGAMAIAFGAIGGVLVGIVSAVRRGGGLDHSLRFLAVLGLSVPNYVVGLLLLTTLAMWFQWSPPLVYRGPFDDFGSWAQQVVIPAFALGTGALAGTSRMTRSSMLEALGADFIRTVRAKGVRERVVLFKHALRSSVISVLTLIGVSIGTILGGTVILERMFGIPGMGSLIYDAVLDRDYPVVVACTVFYAGLFVSVIVIVDLLYAVIDPRIRTGGEAR